jgi:hypothetical protein
MEEESLNRRAFARNILIGAGQLTVLPSSVEVFAATADTTLSDQAKKDALTVRLGKTIEIARSRTRCWFPSVHQFPNKDLIVAMSTHADKVDPEGGYREAYSLSQDGGTTWSKKYDVETLRGVWSELPGPDGSIWGLSGHIVGQEDDRNFLFFRTQLFGPGQNISDSGIKIEQRRDVRLHVSKPVQGLMFTGSILPSRNGSLIACVYSRTKEAPRYYQLAIARSEDDGHTWREESIIASVGKDAEPLPGMGKDGPCEAGLVRLKDGRLFVIYRTGSDGYLGVAWSSDEGNSWTPPTLIPIKGVLPRVRLLSNGVLACSTGRPGPVTMMFSADGTGKSWSQETPIFSEMSTRYTEFLELAPGNLFLVYDSVPYGWKEIPSDDQKSQNVIYGTYLDVELNN